MVGHNSVTMEVLAVGFSRMTEWKGNFSKGQLLSSPTELGLSFQLNKTF